MGWYTFEHYYNQVQLSTYIKFRGNEFTGAAPCGSEVNHHQLAFRFFDVLIEILLWKVKQLLQKSFQLKELHVRL